MSHSVQLATIRDLNDLQTKLPSLISNPTVDLQVWLVNCAADASNFNLARNLIQNFFPDEVDLSKNKLQENPRFPARVNSMQRAIALVDSRQKYPEKVIERLENLTTTSGYLGNQFPLVASQQISHEYSETLGILAGAHKSIWFRDKEISGKRRNAKQHLKKSAQLYDTAFDVQPWNTYVGINLAACHVWLGNIQKAQATASLIIDFFQSVDITLSEPDDLPPWTAYTLAEALLILGKNRKAKALYFALNRKHGKTSASIVKRAEEQRMELQHHLDFY
jgi:hypothetical protein